MKISAIITITNPEKRQDPFSECIWSVKDWADEIIVVDGGNELFKEDAKMGDSREHYLKSAIWTIFYGDPYEPVPEPSCKGWSYYYPWPEEWSWDELPKHLNYGLQKATGDWVVRVDADYVFPADTNGKLRDQLEHFSGIPVVTYQKMCAVYWNQFYQKGGIKGIINKRQFPNVVFGKDREKYSDLCVPIFWDNQSMDRGVPVGQIVPDGECARSSITPFNYDYTFKTKEFTAYEFNRFSLAHERFFGTTKWGHTEEESLEKFINMMRGRKAKCDHTFDLEEQPFVMQKRLKNITPEQFGFNGWGLV